MLSFRNRLLILLTGLVVGAQVVTLFTALASTLSEERRRAGEDLVRGAREAQQLLSSRERQLANAVTVLALDYGLREAIATEHAPTLASALTNHAQRIEADLTVAMDLDGNVLFAQGGEAPVDDAALLQALQRVDERQASFVVTDGAIYQAFAAPVLAPDEVGRVVLGFAVDDAMARDLSDSLGVDVAFLRGSAGEFRIAASSVPRTSLVTQALSAALRASPEEVSIGGAQYLATATHLSIGAPSLDLALLKPMNQVMAPFRRLALILGLVFGVTLLVAVIAGVYLGRSAARPVQRLAAGAARVATGDYSQPVESSGGQELANLANAFNSMQGGIAEREGRLRYMALHDAATGLPNRARLEDWLTSHLQQAPTAQLAVVQIVMTNLQEISATLGFDIAGRLIGHIAQQLEGVTRDPGLVARLDGTGFVVAAQVAAAADATLLARRIRERCMTDLETNGITLHAAVVLGVAIAPRDAHSAHEALRCAHAAVESALSAGEPIGTFAQSSDEAQRRRLTLGADLPDALRNGQLYLVYQPKLRLRDRRIAGVETLVRWLHPVLGQISPAEFVPIAERTGASTQLTRWVLRGALEQLASWRREGIRLHTAVNLSAADLLDERLLQDILGALRDSGLPAGSLTLEITESVLLRDPDTVRRNIELLHVAGVRFSVDDFGTGYSSLSQLRELAADELKIDQSFVRTALRGPEDVAMLKAIVEMGHGLGLRIVAEGVEEDAQCELLAGLGCDYAQGYLISRPQRPAELAPLLRERAHSIASMGDTAATALRRRLLS
jgi:diguanylate cyclase (GGDEF)-like protein